MIVGLMAAMMVMRSRTVRTTIDHRFVFVVVVGVVGLWGCVGGCPFDSSRLPGMALPTRWSDISTSSEDEPDSLLVEVGLACLLSLVLSLLVMSVACLLFEVVASMPL